MYEVEVKFRVAHGDVRPHLDDAVHEHDVRQVDTYYDHPSRDFATTDEALRIRRSTRDGETTALVTYKGPLVDVSSKTREEHETAVDDGEALHAALDGLGFAPAARVEKHREVWSHDGASVTLDDVDGLGEFVEIERESGNDGVDQVREAVLATARELGLDPADQIRDSYLAMLLDGEVPGGCTDHP